jgi:energy-coupling factor transporter ATP-binding protein EcfA2
VKLNNVRVTNYRCVEDSGEFRIDDVTCFVGKNESGKTTLLQALERLKPIEASRAKYTKLTDYPRKWLSEYDDQNPKGEARVLETRWDLSDDDVAAVNGALGIEALGSGTVVVRKFYESPGCTWSVDLRDERVITELSVQCGCTPAEQESLAKLNTVGAVAKYFKTASTPLSPGLTKVKETLAKFRDGDFKLGIIDLLETRMPSFLYFSNYDRMCGKVSIDDLTARKQNGTLEEGQKLFLEFLDFAKISLEDIRDARKAEELRARCEAASINITRQIFEYWSQNRHLKVEFVVESGRPEDPSPFNSGFIMQARIKNQLHDMTVPFSERSAGFVWFFSFLVHFSQVRKQFGNVIILLDEPGLALHAKAQNDLLRYFRERLKPSHQLLYTTHSPFMVPAGNLLSVRTVEDVILKQHDVDVSIGTHVGDSVLSTDRDTLFPLQAALGYEITQSLFVGEHTLLVEGPSDLLYFTSFSEELKRLGRTCLDPRWTICPVGGVDKVPAFLSLFGGNKLDVAIVIDYVHGQKKKLEALRTSSLLKNGRVLTFADLTNKAEADVEDMLGGELYADLINRSFSLPNQNAFLAQSLDASEQERLLEKVEAVFRSMPPSVVEFDHYTPSVYFTSNIAQFSGQAGMAEALDRFEFLFGQLNDMLSGG